MQSAQQDYQELCAVTLQRMRADVEEKIRRLHEEAVVARLTVGEWVRSAPRSCCVMNIIRK